jgi:hypothetical protein
MLYLFNKFNFSVMLLIHVLHPSLVGVFIHHKSNHIDGPSIPQMSLCWSDIESRSRVRQALSNAVAERQQINELWDNGEGDGLRNELLFAGGDVYRYSLLVQRDHWQC